MDNHRVDVTRVYKLPTHYDSYDSERIEDEMTYRTETAMWNWAQRVAHDLTDAGLGEDIFDAIEATLKEQRERITELEAKRGRAVFRHGKEINARMAIVKKLDNCQRELAECRALNAALVSQSAGGAGVRMEYCWKQYGYSDGEIDHANTWARVGGWTLHHIEGIADNSGYVLVVWQRPARNED
jgi:hypothetical protein